MLQTEIVEIARRASSGDAGAFDELYQKTAGDVFWYANRMLRSKEDAEDVMQETLLDMYVGIGRLRVPEAVHGWILHIAKNNCLRLLLRRNLTDSANRERDEELNAAEESGREVLPETATLDREISERLQVAIATLSQFRLQIISLHYFAGMSCMQIARKTGTKTDTVATNLYRARLKMRRILEDDDSSR